MQNGIAIHYNLFQSLNIPYVFNNEIMKLSIEIKYQCMLKMRTFVKRIDFIFVISFQCTTFSGDITVLFLFLPSFGTEFIVYVY